MGPRSSKTREDHFSLFSDLKFTSVKISNNALNFLLAQYRAIFKRAYIKGIASAVILTAGLAAGQAQAAASADNPAYTVSGADSSTWTVVSGAITANGDRLAGDYDTGNAEDTVNANNGDGIVSGESLILGSGDSVTSGSAYAGYVSLDSGSTLDAVAENNTLTLNSGATINTSGGNVVGGWAKTNGSGIATAQDNKLIIDNSTGGITFQAANQFIGAVAAGNNGATAKDNLLEFTGSGTGATGNGTALINSQGNFGATVFVGETGGKAGLKGTYEALGNTLDMSHFNVTSDTSKVGDKTFVGGNIQILNLDTNNTIDAIRAQGNTVKLDDFTLGAATHTNGYQIGNIAANSVAHLESTKQAVDLVEANGSGDTGVILSNGKIYGATVYGGFAQNVAGGSANANSNIVSITDTDLLVSTSGSGPTAAYIYNAVTGGHAESTVTSGGQKVALEASSNTVNIENTADDITTTRYAVNGPVAVMGAHLSLTSGGTGVSDFVGSTLTANNNTVTIGAGIDVTGSIAGALIQTDSKNITSGGATIRASGNTVTFNGTWHTSPDASITTVVAEAGQTTAENNKLIINGEVDGGGALIAAVVASAQPAITSKLDNPPAHQLSNNSIEIGADAVIDNADIYAVRSSDHNAYTLNNDVTVAGTVSNSDIYGGTGADSLVDVQANSRLTYNDGTAGAGNGSNHVISSDNVDLGGVISVGQYDTLSIKGYANNGNTNTTGSGTKYNTNLTNIESTAELYNRGTVELLGDTTVTAGAQLHALADGATIKVNGDSGKTAVSTDTDTLKLGYVGGRGQLTISKAQLQSYLTAGDNYTLDNTSSTDKAGTVEVTSGGVLEFTDSNIDLATLDYTTDSGADTGKILVGESAGSTVLKGDAVTISHALASNGTKFADGTYTLNKDGKFGDDYGVLSGAAIKTTGVSIEANDLILGSSRINAKQSEDIKFEKATAKDSINFTVGSGTFTLASEVAGNNYMHTNNLDSDLEYFTALNGTITGDVDVISGGELTIEYGHWTAQGDIELKADTSAGEGGKLNVGIDNTDTDARNYIDKGNAKALPDATLVLDQALTVNLSGAGTATVTVDGQSSGWTGDNRLGVYDEQLAQSTVGDDHYVMLDLRNGLDVVGTDAGVLSGKFQMNVQSGGVVKMMADDLNTLLVQNDGATQTSGSFISVHHAGRRRNVR